VYEGPGLRIETIGADIGVDLRPDPRPAFDVTGQVELLRALDHAIERHPGHDFRICEVLALPAHFPDAFIRFAP
jgi:hypothetical protein